MAFRWFLDKFSPFQRPSSSAGSKVSQAALEASPGVFARVTEWLSATPRQLPTPPSTGEKRKTQFSESTQSSPLGNRPIKAAKVRHHTDTGIVGSPEAASAVTLQTENVSHLEQEGSGSNLTVAQMRSQGWHEADISLYRRINSRGLEPLLPLDWKIDFRILPFSFFTSNEDKAYIKPSGKTDVDRSAFRGSKALEKLFEMGPVARDDMICDVEPHRKMARAFNSFIKWTMDDALLANRKGVLPLIKITSGSVHTPIKTLQTQMLTELRQLEDQWRTAAPQQVRSSGVPLYGVIVSGTVWAIVSYLPEGISGYDPNTADAYLRTIGIFNFDDSDYDVWNGLAFAVVAVHARNRLLDILEAGQVPAYDGSILRQSTDKDW